MAKRFIDNEILKKPNFRTLPDKYWRAYITLAVLDCDNSGVWEVDFDRLSFLVNGDINEAEFLKYFGDKITKIKGKYFIPAFIDRQYGELKETVKPHIPVIKRLKELNLYKGYLKGINTLKEQEQEKEQEKDYTEDFEKLWIITNPKSQKRDAFKQFNIALKKTSLVTLVNQRQNYQSQVTDHTPQALFRWLKEQRWEDTYKTERFHNL